MPSTSSYSEMSFDSEKALKIYYIVEVGTADQHHTLNSNDNDQADLYADNLQADKEWTAK